jgi:hypothetical protein
MLGGVTEPLRVRLQVGKEEHAAVVLELSGHRAAIRSARALELDADVCLRIDWRDGAWTSLPARVQAVAPAGHLEHLAHVEVTGIEGDWRPFLAYVGPTTLAS